MPTIAERRAAFRKLHESGCFVIPNPWDIGTARYLAHLGFKALATTSAGFAFSRGRADNAVPRDEVIAHVAELVAATDLPVNADFENGFAHEPGEVAQNVRLCAQTGVAGLSIEDSTGNAAAPLYPLDQARARIRAARDALDRNAPDVMLVGRAECFLVGRPDLTETIARLQAYAAAGADCLYAPGLRKRDDIAAVVAAVAPRPVNVLVGGPVGLTVADLTDLGVRRVSVGGALARAAWAGFIGAATELAQHGTFGALGNATPHAELNAFFR
ncbi:MAG: isocitrate lyase/phosphoenolpyruvate mutase family protein [Burkholderiales bacterium]|nr:isocitrate lyase/phosphoenolpyruvate mutase family protein [Burkholderiales bacterium]